MLEEGNLRRISGTAKAKSKFEKYHVQTEVKPYPTEADSTLPSTSKKRKHSEVETPKKLIEELPDADTESKSEKKKKKKKGKETDADDDVETPMKKVKTEVRNRLRCRFHFYTNFILLIRRHRKLNLKKRKRRRKRKTLKKLVLQ